MENGRLLCTQLDHQKLLVARFTWRVLYEDITVKRHIADDIEENIREYKRSRISDV